MLQIPYDRRKAVAYARRWAFARNPAYYDYERIGGDCTNYASQCLYAGTGIMNFDPDPQRSWYYRTANDKAPAWTGVEYFYRFLTRREESAGPFGKSAGWKELRPGDLIQLNFGREQFSHTLVVVRVGKVITPRTVLVAAHSYDVYGKPLSNYSYQRMRAIHIEGAYQPEPPEPSGEFDFVRPSD